MNRSEPFDGETPLGYRSAVSPYLSIAPHISQSRTFLRFYPESTKELVDELLDEILELPEERFLKSASIFDERFVRELGKPFLEFLPISRGVDEILGDLQSLFEDGQRRTVKRLLTLEDPRAHLVVVVYTELILRAIGAIRRGHDDPRRCLSAVLPLVIRLDKAHGNKEMTDGFIVDAALAEHYLQLATDGDVDRHPNEFDFELLEYDVLSFGVAITYRESDISASRAAEVIEMAEEDFDRLLELYDIEKR